MLIKYPHSFRAVLSASAVALILLTLGACNGSDASKSGLDPVANPISATTTNPDGNTEALDNTPADETPIDDTPIEYNLTVRVSEDVSAEVNKQITLSGEVLLQNVATDLASVSWEKVSGAGIAHFASPDSLQTSVSFDTAGTYVVRMRADYEGVTSADTVVVTVTPAEINQAPVVDAGRNGNVELGQAYQLAAKVSDDGLPTATLSVNWSQVSGAGVATFSEVSQPDATVTFSQAGDYILRISADDSELSATDQLKVTVSDTTPELPAVTPVASATALWQRVHASNGSKPQARHEAGGLAMGNQFYLIGGRGSRQVNRYDLRTKRWENLGTPDRQMSHFQPVEWRGKIYVIGALECCYPSENVIDRIQIFDPVTKTWSQGASMPANRKRGSAGTVVYKNKIYIVGGSTNGHDGGFVNWFDEYDPTTNTWKTLPNAPTKRDHFYATVVGNRLVAAGGRQTDYPNTFGNLVDKVDVYNFDTKKWETNAPDIPVPRAGTVAVSYGSEVLVIGGEKAAAGAASKRVDAYNVTTRRWRRLDDMIESRHGGGAALLGTELHVASGSNNRGGGPETQGHEKLELND